MLTWDSMRADPEMRVWIQVVYLRGDPRKQNREMEKVRQMRETIHYGFQDQADYCCRHLSSIDNFPNTGLGSGVGRLGIYPITPPIPHPPLIEVQY